LAPVADRASLVSVGQSRDSRPDHSDLLRDFAAFFVAQLQTLLDLFKEEWFRLPLSVAA
jgi:hypothetical protein